MRPVGRKDYSKVEVREFGRITCGNQLVGTCSRNRKVDGHKFGNSNNVARRSEDRPTGRPKGTSGLIDSLVAGSAAPVSATQAKAWHSQVDGLYTRVLRWTGNPLQVVDISVWEWMNRARLEPALFAEIERDGITLAGTPLSLPFQKVR